MSRIKNVLSGKFRFQNVGAREPVQGMPVVHEGVDPAEDHVPGKDCPGACSDRPVQVAEGFSGPQFPDGEGKFVESQRLSVGDDPVGEDPLPRPFLPEDRPPPDLLGVVGPPHRPVDPGGGDYRDLSVALQKIARPVGVVGMAMGDENSLERLSDRIDLPAKTPGVGHGHHRVHNDERLRRFDQKGVGQKGLRSRRDRVHHELRRRHGLILPVVIELSLSSLDAHHAVSSPLELVGDRFDREAVALLGQMLHDGLKMAG